MKKYFLLILFTSSLAAFSQQKYDQRLLTVYSKDKLDKMMVKAPGHVRWLSYQVAHMYEFTTLDKIKSSKIDTLKTFDRKLKKVTTDPIGKLNETTFNPYLYNIQQTAKEDRYYLIPGTNKVIHIFPRSKVINEYNNTIK